MRLGPHICRVHTGEANDRRARRYIEKVQPPFVKVLGEALNREFLQFCRAQGCEIVGRIVFANDRQGLDDGTVQGNFNAIREKAIEFPEIGWWEFLNECHHQGDDMNTYAGRCIEFMRMIEGLKAVDGTSRRAVVGSFSTGTPDESQWERFRPAVEHAWHNGHAIGVHQYASPDMRFMCGANQWNSGQPHFDDPCTDPKAEGWHTLRHRKFLPIFRSWGVSARVIITESGNDDIFQDPPLERFFGQKNNKKRGYKQWRSFGHQLWPYADQLRWYSWQLGHDPEVIGVVDFGFGIESGEWEPFDLSTDEAMLDQVIAGQKDLPRDPGTLGTPVTPVTLPARATAWHPGDTVTTTASVALRRSPGYIDKPEADRLAVVPKGTGLTLLIGGSQPANNLSWWPVRFRAADGLTVEGFMAERNRSGTVLLERTAEAPPFVPGARVRVITGRLNLRQAPGHVGKPPGDVVTTVPGGNQMTVLGGPESRDGLRWWNLRYVPSAIETHEGWAADGTDDTAFLADVAFAPAEAEARG
jgi:hypothetical protein